MLRYISYIEFLFLRQWKEDAASQVTSNKMDILVLIHREQS